MIQELAAKWLKIAAAGVWVYIVLRKDKIVLRFKKNRRRQIVAVQTMDMVTGMRLFTQQKIKPQITPIGFYDLL